MYQEAKDDVWPRHPHPPAKGCFRGKPAKLYDQTHPDWAPSLKLKGNEETETKQKSLERYQRRKERKFKHETHSAAQALLDLSKVSGMTVSQDGSANISCKFFLAGSLEPNGDKNEHDVPDVKLFVKMQQECQRLTTANFELRGKLADTKISKELFSGYDKKVQ
ncbi:hypothetical protein GQR58_014378 [Nymphon striatum]|nr:hypothetical protein GQR58_016193 [Nymphon striatum]KAG1676291.1 hypothetical protein GQR58_014378 [Nymphon striatum]